MSVGLENGEREALSPQDRQILALIRSALFLSQGSDDETKRYLQLQYWLNQWNGVEFGERTKELFLGVYSPKKHNEIAGKPEDKNRGTNMLDYFNAVSSYDRFARTQPELELRSKTYMLPDTSFMRYRRMIAADTLFIKRADGRLGKHTIEERYASFLREYCIDGKVPFNPQYTSPIFALITPHVYESLAFLEGKIQLYGDKKDTAGELQQLIIWWERRHVGKQFFSPSETEF